MVSGRSLPIYAFDPNGTLKRKYDLPRITGGQAVTGSSIAIGSDGTLYCGDFYYRFDNSDTDNIIHMGAVYALRSDSNGLADTEWPKFRCNNKNTAKK